MNPNINNIISITYLQDKKQDKGKRKVILIIKEESLNKKKGNNKKSFKLNFKSLKDNITIP